MTPWERWWSANRERFLQLRRRLRERDGTAVASGAASVGLVAGDGGPSVRVFRPDSRSFAEKEILQVVTRALRDDDAEVRSAAAVALGKMGFPRSLPDLLAAWKDRDRDVRESAVLATGMLGDALASQDLRDLLLDPGEPDRVRSFAAVALGLAGGAESGAALLAYLDPATDEMRSERIRRRPETEACAILALGLAGQKAASGPLRLQLLARGNGEAWRRGYAAVALAKLGDREATPLVLAMLGEDAEVARQGAAVALGLLGRPDDVVVVKALAQAALGDRDLSTRSLAAMSLAQIGGDEARRALRTFLEKGEKVDLPFAALALGAIGDGASAAPLREAFAREKNPGVRGALALGLGLLRDRASVPAVREAALGKGDRDFRCHCLVALGLLGDPEAAAPVRGLIAEEHDAEVKVAAGICLGLLQDRDAIPALIETARNGKGILARGHACRVLGAIGDEDAARALLRLAADVKETGYLRMNALVGLGTLAERTDLPILSRVGACTNTEARLEPLDLLATIL